MFPAFLSKIHWGEDLLVSCGFAQLFCTSREQDRAVGFGEEDQCSPGGAGDDEPNPEDPAPTEGGSDKAGKERCGEWADTSSLGNIPAWDGKCVSAMGLTPMKTDIALPLVTGLSYISAYTPPMTAMGLLAFIPVASLKNRKDPQFGATAQAIVKIVKNTKVDVMITFLPYVSDNGPNNKGPRIYPTRYMEMGRTSADELVMWKCELMIGIAFEGSEEPIVLLTTTTMPMRTIQDFFL